MSKVQKLLDNMKKISRFLSRLRTRQVLRCLIFLLVGTYCITLLKRLQCSESYRNLASMLSKGFNISEDISCYHKEDSILEFVDELKYIKKNGIYIISTSCDSSITLHHACVIESVMESHYYEKKVYVFVNEPIKDCLCDEEIFRGLSQLPTLQFITIQIDKFVEDTPLKGVFKGDFLKIGVRQKARVAEYLKFAALYKFGGVVIDFDLIVSKPLWNLGLNWGARMNGSQLGSAAIALDKKTPIGKSLLKRTMVELKKQRNQVEVDGGLALTEAFRHLCYDKPVQGCPNFAIHDANFFYPYNKSSNHLLFKEGDKNPRSYGFYFWEKRGAPRYDTVYGKLMMASCPRIAEIYGLK